MAQKSRFEQTFKTDCGVNNRPFFTANPKGVKRSEIQSTIEHGPVSFLDKWMGLFQVHRLSG